mgnify:FL=1
MLWGDKLSADMKFEVPISSQLKVTVQDRVNLSEMVNDPKNAAYNWGVTLEFKL